MKRGAFFWGCSRYPVCRETVDIPSLAPTHDVLAPTVVTTQDSQKGRPVDLPGGGAVIGEAGGSARRTYERRRAAHDARRGDRLSTAAPKAIAAAVLVGAFLLVSGQALVLALSLGAAIGAVVVIEAIAPRQSTLAWSIGAEGEERTAEYLDPLAAIGYVIFHDRRIPMSRANIDHIVVGPTGVFVVETKNVAGDLRVRGDEVRIGGRRVAVVDEVGREIEATWNVVAPVLAPKGLHVIPIVCSHRAELPIFRRSVAGIRIVSGRGLARYIRGRADVLSAADIQEVRRLVLSGLLGKD